jgi:hypothetical protein
VQQPLKKKLRLAVRRAGHDPLIRLDRQLGWVIEQISG